MTMPRITDRMAILWLFPVSYAASLLLPEALEVSGRFPAAGASAANAELELGFGSSAVEALASAESASEVPISNVVGWCL
jgi:hypothetical protein